MPELGVLPAWLPPEVVVPSLRRLVNDNVNESLGDICTDMAMVHDSVWQSLGRSTFDSKAFDLIYEAFEMLKGRSIKPFNWPNLEIPSVSLEQACADLIKFDKVVRSRLITHYPNEAEWIKRTFKLVHSLLEFLVFLG